jgi:phosphatidate cytidylyltransferase
MLIPRILTALFLIPAIIWIVFSGNMSVYFVLILVLLALSAWEWASLAGVKTKINKIVYAITCLGGLLFTLFASTPIGAISTVATTAATLMLLTWCGIAIYLIYLIVQSRVPKISCAIAGLAGFWLLGLFVTSIGFLLIRIGPIGIMYVLALVWLADTLAYFFGKQFGKRPLAITISPNKTWIGFYAGILIPLCAVIFFILIAPLSRYVPHVIRTASFNLNHFSLSIIWNTLSILLASVVGDLFISALKRSRQIKETGSLLPGHGGILDRIDGLLAAMPIATFNIYFLTPDSVFKLLTYYS